MLRIARNAGWILAGAAAVFYLVGEHGGQRRQRLAAGISAALRSSRTRIRRRNHQEVSAERVSARAGEPLPEETTAGVPTPAPAAMARRILEESDARVAEREA